jgi:hypothetical protein
MGYKLLDFKFSTMINIIVGAEAAGAASRYGSGLGSCFDHKMRLLAAPAPQHCFLLLKKK